MYLDTSALVSLFVADAHGGAVQTRLQGWPGTILVSTFGVAEFGAAVGNRVRNGAMSAESGLASCYLLDGWLLKRAETQDLLPEDHRDAALMVRDFSLGLRAPDALHVALCHRLGAALLTYDARQAAAARRLGLALDPAGA